VQTLQGLCTSCASIVATTTILALERVVRGMLSFPLSPHHIDVTVQVFVSVMSVLSCLCCACSIATTQLPSRVAKLLISTPHRKLLVADLCDSSLRQGSAGMCSVIFTTLSQLRYRTLSSLNMACQLVGTMRGQTMTYHDIESASWSYWFAITAFALLLFLPYQRLLFTAAGSMNNAYTIPHTLAK
jgi:hypothetical protein